MRKTIAIPKTLLSLGLLLACGLARGADRPTAAARAAHWTAVAASGSVEAAAATEADWRAVRRGDELAARSVLRTGSRGHATLTHSASVVIVDPNSRVELPEPGSGRNETSVVQTSGSVVYEVDRRKTPHFEVVTPHLIAGVKGTRFLVTVSEGRTSITVDHGLVEALDLDRGLVAEVGAGQSLFLDVERGRFERIDLEDGGTREARREAKRMARMEQRDEQRRERDPLAGDVALAERAAKTGGEHDDSTAGWVADMDCIKRGLDGHSAIAVDDTGREDEAFGGGKDGDENADKDGASGKEEPAPVDDPIIVIDPIDVPGVIGGGKGSKSNLSQQ